MRILCFSSSMLFCRRGLREFGVSVHVVEPGYFSTCTAEKKQIMAESKDRAWKALPENIKKSFGVEDYLENREYTYAYIEDF